MTTSLELAALVTEDAMARLDVLIVGAETAFVSETATGLAFDADTPIEVWAPLVVRLYVQSKRLEWCLADAIIFGESAYPDIYTQWVAETGLNKRTLQNYARVGRAIAPARRRATLSFSHHEAVATLPADRQKTLLDTAESAGMSRYELRDAVRVDRELAQRRAEGMVDGTGEEAPMVWVPTLDDLIDEMRAVVEQQAPLDRHRLGWISGVLWVLVWRGEASAFRPERWQG